MEQIEEHAFETYDSFLATDGDRLAALPAPQVALNYYTTAGGSMYLFDGALGDLSFRSWGVY